MFVRSFNNFKKEKNNFKFQLVEHRSLDDSDSEQLILENKEQALKILSRKNVRTDNPTFILFTELINKIFKNLNYLGLITKFKFEQEVSTQELKDLLVWLKQSGNKLPKNPLTYKTFETLKDDIIKTDNKQRVKTIYNKLPREQKDLIKNKALFFEKALALHKLGMVKEFGRKLGAQKTEIDLIAYMDDFIEKNSKSITFDGITQELRSLNSEILIEDPDTGIIMAEIFDYKTSKETGSSDWCIVTGEGSWNTYTRGTRRQFFMWDFSENRTSALFLIGFTSNSVGQITNIHDKYDVSLKGTIPVKIKNVLKNINISTDPFEFKNEILTKLGNGFGEKIPYNDDNNIIIIQTDKEGYGSFRSEAWSSYNPFSYGDEKDEFYFYVIYNFNYAMNDPKFCYGIELSDDGIMKLLDIMDNTESNSYIKIVDDNISGVSNEFILNLYNDGYIKTKTIEDIYNEKKNDYLFKLEGYVKNGESISSKYEDKKSKYINTSDDPGSTGDYWLFKIENDELDKFSTSIIDDWNPMYGKLIVNFNVYALIKLDESFRSPDFIRFIKLGEDSKVIKFNLKHDSKSTLDVLPTDIQDFIDKGFIEIKSNKKYHQEVSAKRIEIFEESNSVYDDNYTTELYGKILFEYLVENGHIEEDDYDSDDEMKYRKILIASSHNHWHLRSFTIYTYNMLINRYGNGSEWAIGDNDDADRSATESLENSIEDMGAVKLVGSTYASHYIDSKRFARDYGDDSYYYDEVVREDPSDYGIEKAMTDENIEKLEEIVDERDEIEEKKNSTDELIEKTESRRDKYEEFVDKKMTKIDELQLDDLDKNDSDYQRKFDRLETIKKKLEIRSEINLKRYENLIDELGSKLIDLEERFTELDTLVDEMEDEDNDDYWEYDESEIDNKIEELTDDRKESAEDDPSDYLKDIGYDEEQIKEILSQYVDNDKLIKSIISDDGRGSTLSSYDGKEIEYYYDDTWYYIYLQNK